jgi:hypothetical protein
MVKHLSVPSTNKQHLMVAGVVRVAFCCFFVFPSLLLDFHIGFKKIQINP